MTGPGVGAGIGAGGFSGVVAVMARGVGGGCRMWISGGGI
jgi:hypothetical protein